MRKASKPEEPRRPRQRGPERSVKDWMPNGTNPSYRSPKETHQSRRPVMTCAACRQTPTNGKPYCPPCWNEIQRKRKEVGRYGP